MKSQNKEKEGEYEIIIKKVGDEKPLETNIMSDWHTQKILWFIGRANLGLFTNDVG